MKALSALVAAVLLLVVSALPAAAQSPAPSNLVIGGDGAVYVTDHTNDRVVKYAPDGTVAAQWGR